MKSWWPFPPKTRIVQLDEKWSYVSKKQDRLGKRELASERIGDCWDHLSFDPQHRLVLALIVDKRFGSVAYKLVAATRKKLLTSSPLLLSDNWRPYALAIAGVWKNQPTPAYGVLSKQVHRGRLVGLERRLVLGEMPQVEHLLAGRSIGTSLLERFNATDRHRSSRKGRRTYCFSKDWLVHEAASRFSIYSYNFCWPVRTLREKKEANYRPCTPAMSAGLTDHVWSIGEWLSLPAIRRSS